MGRPTLRVYQIQSEVRQVLRVDGELSDQLQRQYMNNEESGRQDLLRRNSPTGL
jgi:hypothetical protein